MPCESVDHKKVKLNFTVPLQTELPAEMKQNENVVMFFDANDSISSFSDSNPKSDSTEILPQQQDSISVAQTFITHPSGIKLQPIERKQSSYVEPFVLILIGLSLTILVLAKYFLPRRFFQLLGSYSADRHVNQLLREWNPFKSMPGPAFLLLYVILFALSLYFSLHKYLQVPKPYQAGIFVNIATLVFLFTLLRLLASKFIALVFKAKDLYLHLHTIEFSHYLVSSLVMIPAMIIITFYPGGTGLSIGLFLIVIVFVFSFIRIFYYSLKASPYSVFYLFLYLCALEIVPFLLLLKTVSLMLSGEFQIIRIIV
ncbi:MAG: hypothetical protein PWQ54_1422 [Bacteroidales bacterium]|jgi:hypothetical protein|nr:hypothetical protein [Bacteroidales bacterium]